jgi:excisionase family DNA binding protein
MNRKARRTKPVDEVKHSDIIGLDVAGKMLGVERQTVRSLIKAGKIPGYRVGPRLIRVNREDVKKLLVPITD